ncbi:MAG: nucleotidyltransferase domain-containing protein [Deltaproteobacteria bacterium]|nr:nucleotidyltransferase domain-containing protein [Deltaproteobacteria bacterium]
MLYLDRAKLEEVLRRHGLSLAALARQAGISRQSLYLMFKNQPVFAIPFQRVLDTLHIDYRAITKDMSVGDTMMAVAPIQIHKVTMQLIEFCRHHHADLVLFGSRTRGKMTIQADWDFGVWFRRTIDDYPLRVLKQQLVDRAFPYRIDVVNLNQAPPWFRKSVDAHHVVLYGAYRCH